MTQRPWNVFVEGDNLDVLPTLEPASVDLVYIDPPYNTGNDFAYADDFRRRRPAHPARRVGGDDAATADGGAGRADATRRAIFVSIDDNEAAHLRLLLDEVFGEAQLPRARSWSTSTPRAASSAGGFATSHEYLLAYARDAEVVRARRQQRRAPSTHGDFPLTDRRRAPASGTCRCATPTRSSTRSPRRTLHFPV